MSLDVGRKLIHAVLATGDLSSVQTAGIGVDWLDDVQEKRALAAIMEYASATDTIGQVPGASYLVRRMAMVPGAYDGTETVPQLVEAMKSYRMGRLLSSAMQEASSLNSSDPMGAYVNLISALTSRDIESLRSKGRELSLHDLVPEIFQHYMESVSAQGITGVPTPFAALTHSTKGWQRGDMYCLYASKKSFKCISLDAPILQRDGTFEHLSRLPESCEVPSFTQATGQSRWAKATRFESGTKPGVELVTSSGRRLRSSWDHPFMVPGFSFRRVNELKVGDWVAASTRLPEADESGEVSDADAHMLGLLLGDGGLTKGVTFTKTEPTVVAALRQHAERWGCALQAIGQSGIQWSVSRVAGTSKENPVAAWLRDLRLYGLKSVKKFIPAEVFRAGRTALAAMLAGLLDTDGSVQGSRKGVVSWSTSSRRLADDVVHACLRLDLRVAVRKVSDVAWRVTISDVDGLRRLNTLVGPHMSHATKRASLELIANAKRLRDVAKDGIPKTREVFELIQQEAAGRPWPRGAGARPETRQGPTIARRDLLTVAQAWGSTRIAELASAELRYERIAELNDVGPVPCWDISIEDGQDPNFLVADFVVHNSWIMLLFMIVALRSCEGHVLFVTSEMPPAQLGVRLLCLLNGWNFNDYRDRKIGIRTVVKMLSQDGRDRIHFYQPAGFDEQAVAEVRGQIKRLNLMGGVSLVLWDGHYRSASKQEWEFIYNLTRKTRALALEPEILRPPIIVATQEGSTKGQATHAVYGQEASLMLYGTKTGPSRLLMQTTAVREGPSVEMEVEVDLKRSLITQVSSKSEVGEAQGAGGLV